MNYRYAVGLTVQVALILLLSLGAYAGVIPTTFTAFPHIDKVGHAFLFGGAALFLDAVLCHRRVFAFPSLAAIAVLLPAGIDEYAQRFSSNRSSDIWDFVADVVGVALGVILARRLCGPVRDADRATPPDTSPA